MRESWVYSISAFCSDNRDNLDPIWLPHWPQFVNASPKPQGSKYKLPRTHYYQWPVKICMNVFILHAYLYAPAIKHSDPELGPFHSVTPPIHTYVSTTNILTSSQTLVAPPEIFCRLSSCQTMLCQLLAWNRLFCLLFVLFSPYVTLAIMERIIAGNYFIHF